MLSCSASLLLRGCVLALSSLTVKKKTFKKRIDVRCNFCPVFFFHFLVAVESRRTVGCLHLWPCFVLRWVNINYSVGLCQEQGRCKSQLPHSQWCAVVRAMVSINERSFTVIVSTFLLLLDILVPPVPVRSEHAEVSRQKGADAADPTQPTAQNDRLSKNLFLVHVWTMPMIVQVLLAVAGTAALAFVWELAVGKAWASGGSMAGNTEGVRSSFARWARIGFVVSLGGFVLRRWAKHALADHFEYLIGDPGELITHGPYRWLAHPGYTGSMLHVIGIEMMFLTTFQYRGTLLLALAAASLATMRVRIMDEEEMLSGVMGDVWNAHIAERWHLIPFVW